MSFVTLLPSTSSTHSTPLEAYAYQIAKKITPKQAGQVKMRITRVLDIANIKFISELTESRITTAISSLRVLPQTKKKRKAEMPLASPRTRNGYLRAILQ